MVDELIKDMDLDQNNGGRGIGGRGTGRGAGVVFQIGDTATNQLPDGEIKYKVTFWFFTFFILRLS